MQKENSSLPLTKSQSLLWLGQEMNPESPMYNMVMTYQINGKISSTHFKTAFQKLVSQSDALRSVFVIENGIPKQQFLANLDYNIKFIDFSNENHPKEKYKIWVKERVNVLFDLQKCLFDCALIKLSETNFIWYINQHHLITDGWSTTNVFSQMSNLYEKALQNEIDGVEEFPKYQDYVSYCEEITNSGKTAEASKHWQEKLSNFIPTKPLYFKKIVPLKTDSERSLIKLGNERTVKIKEFANKKGIRGWTLDATLYNIFLTSLFSFLHRVTGQENVTIGSPIHNRTSKKFKKTIGLFIETFPLQINIEEGETFISLFKKIQIESNIFLKNAKVGTSSPDLNRNFNTLFNYINAANNQFNGHLVNTEWVHSGHTDPRHHLRLHVHDFDNSDEIQLYFDLNTNVFNEEERNLLPQHFLSVLDAFIDNHSQNINAVPIITQTEINKIAAWNNTYVKYSENETLLTKFELQVQKKPNKIALRFENETLTYKEFDDKSNQIARFLINKNIIKGDIVTISMDRSLEVMICIYGTLKVGAVYLPVDTNIPEKRLNFIVNDAKSKVLFYNHNNISDVSKEYIDCYKTSAIEEEVSRLDIASNNVKINPNDLAYIIYTSGSTGEPKGVKCHHKGICNRLNWMNADYPLTSKDVLLQKTPITFDVSLPELFWPLQTGASLVIEKPEGHKNPERLIETIKKYKVTQIHFVPSMLDIFNQTEDVKECTSLKKIFCSGEALSTATVSKTYNLLDVNIYNLYGPTEASVEVTSWLCKKNNDSQSIPIGKPVANTKLYIVDKFMNLAPIGIPGELYISGTQVAQGYLKRETLTKKHFLKDIFAYDSQNTMYKTGDLVKYRFDGAIEYLGRIDNQIKLRGQRIELGEIEKSIEKHSSISKAIVSADTQDNLVAHYTGTQIDANEIIALLQNSLPLYMVPSQYIFLTQFDLSTSGKIDRKKLLLDYPASKIIAKKTRIAPQNEIEEIIYNVWKAVLKIDEIGIHENFIRIGGNSLDAISITSRLKEILELEVSINDVFNYPNIQSYAKYIEDIITKLLNES